MRVIGVISSESHAKRLSQYLTVQAIHNSCEPSFDPKTGHMSYQIWIHEEDKLALAASLMDEFQKNPTDSKFDSQVPAAVVESGEALAIEQPPVHRFKTRLTTFFLSLCILFFMINTMQEKEGAEQLTDLQQKFMYDMPANFQFYWHGIYDWVVDLVKNTSFAAQDGPLFEKIRQGEFWRLFTPCLLHSDILHILFNMLWLWYLGRPIEQRIGPFRTLILTLIAGIGTNTLQYLMSGPFFVGYSGIITAFAAFIWRRERIAPWEGYPLNRSTIFFLLFFVLAIFGLQVASFVISLVSSYDFTPNIANTAHLTGALIGALLGRFSFFAQRVKH